jgi:hypothetical protein
MKITLGRSLSIETPWWMDAAGVLFALAIGALAFGVLRWMVLLAIGVAVAIGAGWLIHRRYQQIRAQDAVGEPGSSWPPAESVERLGCYDHAGVKWNVYRWRASRRSQDQTSPEEVRALPPPLCPRCQMALTQKHSFWGGLTWRCPSRDFKRWTTESEWQVARQVEALVRREVEHNPWWPRPDPPSRS